MFSVTASIQSISAVFAALAAVLWLASGLVKTPRTVTVAYGGGYTVIEFDYGYAKAKSPERGRGYMRGHLGGGAGVLLVERRRLDQQFARFPWQLTEPALLQMGLGTASHADSARPPRPQEPLLSRRASGTASCQGP
jgi:hypothetical protein